MNNKLSKPHLGLLLGVLLTSAAQAAPKIVVQIQLFEVPADTRISKNPQLLGKQKGVDSATLPRLITTSGKEVTGSLIREFRPPGKGVFQIGTVLKIRPTLQGDSFHYSVDSTLTDFRGFVPRSSTQAPILDVRKVVGFDGTARPGEAVWFDYSGLREEQQTIRETGHRDRTRTIRSRLFAVLRFDKQP